MAKLLSVTMAILFNIQFLSSAHAVEKIAVLDFKSILAPEELGPAVAEILRTELSGLGEYTVIERGMLEQLMQEQALQLSGTVDSETAVKIGKLVGASTVVAGSIVRTGDTYTINSRFVDVETGIARTGKNVRGQGENQISAMVHQLALIITGKAEEKEIPIAFVEPKSVYIDDFKSQLDRTKWKTEGNQSLYLVDQKRGGVRFSKRYGGDQSFQSVGLVFLDKVLGNFDARVGFFDARIRHPGGSIGNQIELTASFGNQLFIVVYSDEPWLGGLNCHVWADPPGAALGTRKITADKGTLRITREGTLVTGYFNDEAIFSNRYDAEAVTRLSFNLNNNATKDATSVIFNAFFISCEKMIPWQ